MSTMSHRKDAGAQSTDREFLNKTTSLVVDKAIVVHSKLGPGLLESVYSTCLTYEWRKAGATVVTEQIVPVFYDELQLDDGYRLDMPVHEAQLISYLKLLDKRVGLLLNFKV